MSRAAAESAQDPDLPILRFTGADLEKLEKEAGVSLVRDLAKDHLAFTKAEWACAVYFYGSRHWKDAPPSLEAVKELDFFEVLEVVQATLEGLNRRKKRTPRPGG